MAAGKEIARCPCCGAAESDWNAPHANPNYVMRDEKLERLRAATRETLRVSGLDVLANHVTKLHALMNEE